MTETSFPESIHRKEVLDFIESHRVWKKLERVWLMSLRPEDFQHWLKQEVEELWK